MERPSSDLPPRGALVAAAFVAVFVVALNVYAAVVAFGQGAALAGLLSLGALIVVGAALAGADGMSKLQLSSLAAAGTFVFGTAGTAAVIVDDGTAGSDAPTYAEPVSLAVQGEALVDDLACTGCHTTSGVRSIGPSWRGLYGSERELQGEGTIVADRDYLVRSIVDPDAEVAAGFSKGLMSARFTKGSVSEEDARAMAAYIESLGGG